MISQYFNTSIEFVKGSATPAVATGDSSILIPLVVTFLSVLAFMFYLFLKQKSFTSKNNNIKDNVVTSNKKLISSVFILIGLLLIMSIFYLSISSAYANNSNEGFAKIDDKIVATVDTENNTVSVSQASFENLQDIFSAGFDYIETKTTQSLPNASLKIWDGSNLIYDNPLGVAECICDYVAVMPNEAKSIHFELDIDMQSALSLVGTSPISITTKVDSLNSVSGVLLRADGKPAANQMIQYEFVDYEPETQIIKKEVYTDSNGNYTLENLKIGSECTIVYGNEGESQLSYKFNVGEDTTLPEQQIPVGYLDTPTPKQDLIYNGKEQAGFDSVGHVSLSGQVRGTDATTYVASAIPIDGYAWSDTKDKASRDIEWSIAKGSNELTNLSCENIAEGETPSPSCTPKWGSASSVVYTYAEDGSSDFKAWNTSNPAGKYTVKAYLAGTDNYYETSLTGSFYVGAYLSTVWENVEGVIPSWDATAITSGGLSEIKNIKAGDQLVFVVDPLEYPDNYSLFRLISSDWWWNPEESSEFNFHLDPKGEKQEVTYTISQNFIDILSTFEWRELAFTGYGVKIFKVELIKFHKDNIVLWESDSGQSISWSAFDLGEYNTALLKDLKVGDKIIMDILPETSADFGLIRFINNDWSFNPDGNPNFNVEVDLTSPRYNKEYTVCQEFVDALDSDLFVGKNFCLVGNGATIFKFSILIS